MAFIVWREGRYAELLHSVRQGKRVRQVRLAWLGARPALTNALKAEVEQKHPGVRVDWEKIEEALGKHPVPPEPDEERFRQLAAAVAEPVLHDWLTRYHRRIRRERIEVVEQEWWPEFRDILLHRPDLPDLLLNPQLLDEAAYRVQSTAEVNYERRRRARHDAQNRQAEAERAQLVAAIDATLAAIQAEHTDGLEWARHLLGAFPGAEERAGDVGYLRARAAEASRRGEATSEATERAIEIVRSAARIWSESGHLPRRLWDDTVVRIPLDAPAELIGERARALAGAAGFSEKEADRNAQVLRNLLDTRRREYEKTQIAAARMRGRRR